MGEIKKLVILQAIINIVYVYISETQVGRTFSERASISHMNTMG